MLYKKKNKVIVLLLSILIGLFVDIKAINLSLFSVNEGEEGGLLAILYFITVTSIVFLGYCFRRQHIKVHPWIVFWIFYILFFYVITNNFIGPPRTKLPMLCIFVVGSLLIPSLTTINAKWLIRAMMFWPSFAALYIEKVFSMQVDWKNSIPMELSYAFLVPIIASIMYLFFYYKNDRGIAKFAMTILVIVNSVFFSQLFLYGSRGPLLSLFSLLLFIYVVRKHKCHNGVFYKKWRLFFLLIFLVIMFVGFSTVIRFGNEILMSLGIDSRFFYKMIELDSQGDVSNGRMSLNEITINGIMDSPWLGNGLDRFDANTGGGLYPHNFILQILYDGGVLFLGILIPVIIHRLIRKYRTCNYDEYVVITMFLFCSVPGAMFSGNLYMLCILWMFFGVLFSDNFVCKQKV